MLKRLIFIIFFLCGGFLFYIPYWILRGTKGSRERKAILKGQKRQYKATLEGQKHQLSQVAVGTRDASAQWYWNGYEWAPAQPGSVEGQVAPGGVWTWRNNSWAKEIEDPR